MRQQICSASISPHLRQQIYGTISPHFSKMVTFCKLTRRQYTTRLTNPHLSVSKRHSQCLKACRFGYQSSSEWFGPCGQVVRTPGRLPRRCLCLGCSACCGDQLTFARMASQQGRRSLTTQCSMTGLRVSEEVRAAVHAGKPVVALESTIITHGMPHPHNEETALAVEQVIRDQGAVPATVGVLSGALCVGLSRLEIQELADTSRKLMKISRRDLPYVMAQGISGGTTVSGTMVAAHAAGVPIFATGGIGGVHRGVEETMDVSADLRELGRTPVAVVSAGVKSILDIPRTLEYLETEGVCVVTYGPTADFPAFFAPRSGHRAPYSIQTALAAADIIDASLRAELGSGMLFAVPIPEEFAASGEAIDAAIHQAVEEARRSQVKGREVTPFILQRVNELTKGESLKANVALIKNNARVAAQIAVALSKKRGTQREEKPTHGSSSVPGKVSPLGWKEGVASSAAFVKAAPVLSSVAKGDDSCSSCSGKGSLVGKPVVVGGAVVDFCAKVKETDIKMAGATYVGKIYQSFGGVGRNIADCMSRLGDPPLFVSALGNDVHAKAFINSCAHMELGGVQLIEGASTPTYCPVLTDSGHLMFGIGDMDLHSVVSPEMVSLYQEEITHAPVVCVDGNFSAAVIQRVCQLCADSAVPVWFEPTDIHKACKPLQTDAWKKLTYISPNLHECAAIWSSVMGQPPCAVTESSAVEEVVSVAVGYCRDLLPHIPVVMVTLGRHGLVLGCREEQMDEQSPGEVNYYPSTPPGHPPPSVVSVSGAGDCLNAAMMHFIIQGHDLDLSIKAGLMAAQHSLQSHNAVPASITPPDFTPEKVEEWAHFQATDVRRVV